MLGLPFRILSTLAIALFFSSKWVRRAMAGIAVSTVIVAFQHQDVLQALAGPGAGHGAVLRALGSLAGG